MRFSVWGVVLLPGVRERGRRVRMGRERGQRMRMRMRARWRKEPDDDDCASCFVLCSVLCVCSAACFVSRYLVVHTVPYPVFIFFTLFVVPFIFLSSIYLSSSWFEFLRITSIQSSLRLSGYSRTGQSESSPTLLRKCRSSVRKRSPIMAFFFSKCIRVARKRAGRRDALALLGVIVYIQTIRSIYLL